ncbi:hypothetical protein PR202_gb06147 [Eleusine coracana subsp. coracana]|uniref:Protein kinase domain-containing protein n=1 Tax=Eleusine coracana subsp. coracana TaxID=191504 RepID=A0AAV5E8M8_ELECO|nr:hypothetical protein PR202_gb06147 [Eleusine coracana subsp. coracana]
MMKTKTPRARAGKARRASAAPALAPKAPAAAEGSSPSGGLSLQLEQVSLISFLSDRGGAKPTRFEALLEEENSLDDPASPPPLVLSLPQEKQQPPLPPQDTPMDADEPMEEKDCCILSQDFFCTPDYITPEMPQLANDYDADKENIPCPKSPEKSVNGRSKRYRKDCSPRGIESTDFSFDQHITPVQFGDTIGEDLEEDQLIQPALQKRSGYVSKSAVALRCWVTPPPCIKNPYRNMDPVIDDVYGLRQCKSGPYYALYLNITQIELTPILFIHEGFSPSIGSGGLSRYRADFHEIGKIGNGNFSVVFKVLNRIDGCLYAVKRSIKQLNNDMERKQAVKEVQAVAALGSHQNIVGYFTSWFENEQLYIQMELCDRCLSMDRNQPLQCREALELLYQVWINGDSRYMPPEMLNDKYENLDKVDIFCLGAAIYELIRGTPLPDSGPHFTNIREGRIALLPGCPMQFQSLIKSMMDPNPVRRPSAKEILGHHVFEKLHTAPAKK